jgi:hypothetical protein
VSVIDFSAINSSFTILVFSAESSGPFGPRGRFGTPRDARTVRASAKDDSNIIFQGAADAECTL